MDSLWLQDEIEVLERLPGPRGELVLRRRRAPEGETVYEIISNGVFLMDSAEMATERALATEGLAPLLERTDLRVLVGGLGLGYTLAAVLAQPGVSRVKVIEIEETVARWVRGPLAHLAGDPLSDARVELELNDLARFVDESVEEFDAALLDVDNGPEFLVHEANAALYSIEGLRRLGRRLSPGGLLTIWSSEPSPGVRDRLEAAFGNAREYPIQVQRGRHQFYYYLYQARKIP